MTMTDKPAGWEPDPRAMGNWRAMFDTKRHGGIPPDAPPIPTQADMPRETPPDDEGLAFDPAEYKPWVLQRGRSRPAMMLHLRRFEAKSGLWMGWQLAYPHLVAVEYVGDTMLSLDFGGRQFMLQGRGLDELAQHLQQGSVLMVQEYSATTWTDRGSSGCITSIARVEYDANHSSA
jgi:hypothetical protein